MAALLCCAVAVFLLGEEGCSDHARIKREKIVKNIHYKGKIYVYRWVKRVDHTTDIYVYVPQPDGRNEYSADKQTIEEIQAIGEAVWDGRSDNGQIGNPSLRRHATTQTSAAVYLLDKVFLYQFDPVGIAVTKTLNLSAPPFTGFPVRLKVTTDGKTGVITNGAGSSGGPYVLLVDLASFTASASIPIPVGVNLTGLALTPDDKLAYVLGQSAVTGACSVYVIDLATQKIVTTVPLGENDLDMNVIGITPDGTEAYIASSVIGGMFSIPVIDIATNTISTRISMEYFSSDTGLLPSTPGSYLAMHPDGTRVYLAPLDGSPIRVIDTATKTITKLIKIPQGDHPWFGTDPVFTPDGQALLVLNAPNGISVIDTTDDTLQSTIDLDPSLVGQAPSAVRIGFSFVPDV